MSDNTTNSNVVRGLNVDRRTSVVAFSSDGKWIAAAEAGELVVRNVSEKFAEVAKFPLGNNRVRSLDFAGSNSLGVLVADESGQSELVVLGAPSWNKTRSIQLRGTPGMVLGHPTRPLLLLSPRDSLEWGRTEKQRESKNHGFVVMDLQTGADVGGAGPLYTSAEMRTLAWLKSDPIGIHGEALVRWSLKDGSASEVSGAVPSETVTHLRVVGSKILVGLQVPPRVRELGTASVDLSSIGTHLYELVAQPKGLVAGVVVRMNNGHVVAVTAQLLEAGRPGKTLPLAWPLSGVAIHPTRDLLAWVQGTNGKETLRVTRISDATDVALGNASQ